MEIESLLVDYLKSFIPTVISLAAAIFSFLTYKRNRRLDNENYLFKTKQENYSKILLEIGNVIDKLQGYIAEAKVFLKNRDKYTENEFDEVADKIDEIADKADDLIFNLENVIIANSLVIPKSVLEKLDALSEMLLDTNLSSSEEDDLDSALKQLDNALTKIINLSNEINDAMRSDLNVEELNLFLYKRLKK